MEGYIKTVTLAIIFFIYIPHKYYVFQYKIFGLGPRYMGIFLS